MSESLSNQAPSHANDTRNPSPELVLRVTFDNARTESLIEQAAILFSKIVASHLVEIGSCRCQNSPPPNSDSRIQSSGVTSNGPQLQGDKLAQNWTAAASLINVVGVSKMLQVSTRQVWKLVASGRLASPVRLGRSARWQRNIIESWIESGCPSVDRIGPPRRISLGYDEVGKPVGRR